MDKYIIYTMGIKEINKAIVKVLLEKGYEPENPQQSVYLKAETIGINFLSRNGITFGTKHSIRNDVEWKEITFRELMELPPVHDELEELAKKLVDVIQKDTEWGEGRIQESEYCKLWERMKPKLGL